MHCNFSHPFKALGPAFYARVKPSPLPSPYWIHFNTRLAAQLNLPLDLPSLTPADDFCGNRLWGEQDCIAMLYAGHQFGHFIPQLGDGRAMQIGSTQDHQGQWQEWQYKGAGPTPFSRQGDGRAVLRSSIREYLCSIAMAGLGIPTTQALSLVGSPQTVWRESVETAAVVLRIAPSFIRFGSFEVFYHRGQLDALRQLADYVITSHYPDLQTHPQPYLGLLQTVVSATAKLIAQWQAVGFCHGVMNTDNMSILGLTLDYGPFGFLDQFNPQHICNHSDNQGRYAYDQQPYIGLWNCYALGQTFMGLVDDKEAIVSALQTYQSQYEQHYHHLMWQKLGLANAPEPAFIEKTLSLLQHNRLDYTRFFSRLAYFAQDQGQSIRQDCLDITQFDEWVMGYQQRLPASAADTGNWQAKMQATNPRYILRNHLAEQAIKQAQEGDFGLVSTLASVLAQPFAEHLGHEHLAEEPPDWARRISVSCSS